MSGEFTGIEPQTVDSAIARLDTINSELASTRDRLREVLEGVGAAGDHEGAISTFEPIRSANTAAREHLITTLVGMEAAAAGLSFARINALQAGFANLTTWPGLDGILNFLPAEGGKGGDVGDEILKIIDKGDDMNIRNSELNKIRDLLKSMTPDERAALLERMTDEQLERLFHNVHSSGSLSNDWDERERQEFYLLFEDLPRESARSVAGRLPPELRSTVAGWFSLALKERPADLDTILAEYQVGDDEMVTWRPTFFPFVSQKVTAKEAALLDELASQYGLLGLKDFSNLRDDALRESRERFKPTERVFRGDVIAGNFDHTDAFRHTYWSARMAAKYGPEFALAYTQAHEGVPGNPGPMEAMDLHNNEVGIRIAMKHPDATPDELADLVEQAVKNGDTVVIDRNGDLAYSDDIPVGDTGSTGDYEVPGGEPFDKDPVS